MLNILIFRDHVSLCISYLICMIVSQGRVVNTWREGSLTRFCFSYLQFLFLGLASWVLDGRPRGGKAKNLMEDTKNEDADSGANEVRLWLAKYTITAGDSTWFVEKVHLFDN
jgi:hypothetical protein